MTTENGEVKSFYVVNNRCGEQLVSVCVHGAGRMDDRLVPAAQG